MSKIFIVDYQAGNIESLVNALRYISCDYEVCSDPENLSRASGIILPGVGSYAAASANLKVSGMFDALQELTINKKVPLLGICLGFQLLFNSSTEGGLSSGLCL